MMALFGMRDAEAARALRLQRARRRGATVENDVIESYRGSRSDEADIIEVLFGTACDTNRIGA
jgi:hypothetical protein